MSNPHKYKHSALAWLAVYMLLAMSGNGQNPCRDTLVYVYDSICEGLFLGYYIPLVYISVLIVTV